MKQPASYGQRHHTHPGGYQTSIIDADEISADMDLSLFPGKEINVTGYNWSGWTWLGWSLIFMWKE
jgi:hypothetical protein